MDVVDRTVDSYKRLSDAATALSKAAQDLREVEPGCDSELIFGLCSAVAGTLLDPGGWNHDLRPMALAVLAIVRDGMPDKIRRYDLERMRTN